MPVSVESACVSAAVYQDIDDMNSFTAPHHHDANTRFNEDEVKTHVTRTLTVVGGC